MTLSTPLRTIGAVAVLAGCAYYNALYNANRLADEASRAEREGRPDEARALWGQAAVKAESVAVRHPESRHRDDALLLQGRALSATGDCAAAVAPLSAVADSSPEPDMRSRARMVLGQCWVALGEGDSAVGVLTAEAAHPDPARRAEAREWRGRAHLLRRDYRSALRDLESLTVDVTFEVALAYLGLGDVGEATRILGQRSAGTYHETQWLAILDSVGKRSPTLATGLVERLRDAAPLTGGAEARLLTGDGWRWLAVGDSAQALARFGAAAMAAPDSVASTMAAGTAAMVVARRTASLDTVPILLVALRAAETRGAGADVSRFVRVLERVAALSGAAAKDGHDLEMFVAAEGLRDSLGALGLAAALFRRLAADHPGSIIAPKALLAAAWLDRTAAQELVAWVLERYPDSPYSRAILGRATTAYVVVEDSLRRALQPEVGQLPARARRTRYPEEGAEDEVIRHGRRPGKP